MLQESLYLALPYVGIAAALFFTGLVFGLLKPGIFAPLIENLFEYAETEIIDKGAFGTFLFIFLHNFIAALASIFLGVLVGVLPLAASFMNGSIIGSFAYGLVESKKVIHLLLLIPHGMFEIPAMLLAWGGGIWFGAFIFRKNREETFTNRWMRVFMLLAYILPLLLMAATIETGIIKLLG